jgi:hypothetical protein
MFGRNAPIVVVNGGSPAAAVNVVDQAAVQAALKARKDATAARRRARGDYLAADAAVRTAFNQALAQSSGPEYLRKAAAEEAAAELRALRDAAELVCDSAEDDVRDAELAFRAAMAGAAPGSGE